MNRKTRKTVESIDYIFVSNEKTDKSQYAKNYLQMIFEDEFERKGIGNSLEKVGFCKEGRTFLLLKVAEPLRLKSALESAYSRILRTGGQYEIGYVTQSGNIVNLGDNYQPRNRMTQEEKPSSSKVSYSSNSRKTSPVKKRASSVPSKKEAKKLAAKFNQSL